MTGTALNDVELTILSLVAEGARYGTEIQQIIELRGLREWLTVGSASVYYVLDRLERQELLTRSSTDAARAVYQITEAGYGVVQTAVADLLSQPRPLGSGFAQGLANIGVLKPQQAYRALIQHQDSLTKQLHAAEALWARRQREESPSEGTLALYTHGITMMQAELGWLSAFIDEWRAQHPVVEREEAAVDTDSGAATAVHHPTEDADRGKKIQQIKRPKGKGE
jgi:DNA-binding PadR family transcriptional regulator